MKTLLVLAPHPDLADAIRAALDPEKFRLIHRINLEEAEPLLTRGMVDICVLDVALTSVQGIWVLEKLRRRLSPRRGTRSLRSAAISSTVNGSRLARVFSGW